ncbi:MAG TPA: hypothetical protein VGH37_01615 [Candidatus Acidoferrum sp.]
MSLSKSLRLALILWVGLSFVVIHYFDAGQVGDSMQSKDGNVSISAGSHPAMVLGIAIAIALFIFLMVKKPDAAFGEIPTRKRRIFAFAIDFWFSMMALSSVGALVPLAFEAVRTGHFAWHFQRNYSASTDGITALFSLLFMALLFLHFAFPLTRGRQTVGCFVTRVRVMPPFGVEGWFMVRSAVVRTFWEFLAYAPC